MTNAAYSAYAQSSFGGIESPTKLIEMLYDGILRFIFRTKKAIEAGDVEKKAIFVELLNSLDYSQGDVAHYLSGLYARQMQLLVLANLNNDVNALNEITNVVKQLSEAWREVTNEQ